VLEILQSFHHPSSYGTFTVRVPIESAGNGMDILLVLAFYTGFPYSERIHKTGGEQP